VNLISAEFDPSIDKTLPFPYNIFSEIHQLLPGERIAPMKINTAFCLCTFIVLLCTPVANVAQENRKEADKKSVAASINADTKDVNKKIKKTARQTKEAIVRDAKAIKEEVPKDLQKAKKDIIKTAKEAKEGATQELREIQEGLKAPRTSAKDGGK
jgi:hypothetical protein